MSTLDRKLLRDLWRIKGQAAAIAAVIAVGVLLQVMMSGLVVSLSETRAAYYERYRLADIFAPLARAPERVAGELARIEGVQRVATRVTGPARLSFPGEILPVRATAVSLDGHGRAPALNGYHLDAGRLPRPGHGDEILMLESFARARGIAPGERLTAILNGSEHSFRVVGLARAPEFLFTSPPGEFAPDDRRYAVLWVDRDVLAAAFDQKGAFNEALIGLARGADARVVADAVDRVLDRWGGRGAYPRDDHLSDRFIAEEIRGLRQSAGTVPPLFLAVAAFLLYIVIARMVQSEREEIGLLKAFGYTNTEIAGHYFRLVLLIAVVGAALGCLGGIAAGRWMVGIYTLYYKFPFLVFRLDPDSFVVGVTASVVAASAGGLVVLRRIFALAPAEAMRPPAPPDYSRTWRFRGWAGQRLDQLTRMVLRRIARAPLRFLASVAGVAGGMALTGGTLTIFAAFDSTMELVFSVADRSDATLTFTRPLAPDASVRLRRIDGVRLVEGVRQVPAVLVHGTRRYRGGITGLPRDATLVRAIDGKAQPLPMPAEGLVLSEALADILGARPGDIITVDVREGARPRIAVPVTGIATTFLGAPAFMERGALNRALGEGPRASAAHLTADAAAMPGVLAALAEAPRVAGASLKADAERSFRDLMNQGAGWVRFVMGAIAFVITFGIAYNAARIAHWERARDLAALRVLGFTRGEVAFVLLGEIGLIALAALPLGTVFGYLLVGAMARGFSTDLYQIPAIFDPASLGEAALVVIAATVVSGWLVKRDIDRADLVAVLKTRE